MKLLRVIKNLFRPYKPPRPVLYNPCQLASMKECMAKHQADANEYADLSSRLLSMDKKEVKKLYARFVGDVTTLQEPNKDLHMYVQLDRRLEHDRFLAQRSAQRLYQDLLNDAWKRETTAALTC